MSMIDVFFNTNEDTLDKLKELGVLSKSKSVDSLLNLVYKELDENNNIIECCCSVVGYSYKVLPKGSLNDIYQSLIIDVGGRVFNINVDYFKDMQKSTFSKVGVS